MGVNTTNKQKSLYKGLVHYAAAQKLYGNQITSTVKIKKYELGAKHAYVLTYFITLPFL